MERLNIPTTLKIGFQKRNDTYSGKLAYVTYVNKKNEIAKHYSWEGWRDKSIDVETFENVPMEGFVLNRKVGGYKSGWNFRQTKCRVYDPRGFELEISIENLLYILQECTSTKGKGLEGKFVYAWNGADLLLLPVDSEDYKASMELQQKQEKITIRGLKVGSAYKGKYEDYLVYLGKLEWYGWKHLYDDYYSYEITKVIIPTFIDINKGKFVGYKNMNNIDYLIEENVLTFDEIEDYIDKFKSTDAYRTQFIDKLSSKYNLTKWNEIECDAYDEYNYGGSRKNLYEKLPDKDYITGISCIKKRDSVKIKEEYKLFLENRILKKENYFNWHWDEVSINNMDLTYMSDGDGYLEKICFSSTDGKGLIDFFVIDNLSNIEIKINNL
jgi:hypothetical protein